MRAGWGMLGKGGGVGTGRASPNRAGRWPAPKAPTFAACGDRRFSWPARTTPSRPRPPRKDLRRRSRALRARFWRVAAIGRRSSSRRNARALRPITSGRARRNRQRPRRGRSARTRGGAARPERRIGGSHRLGFTHVRILDGSGEYPYTGYVVIQGNRIRQVTKGASRLSSQPGGGVGGAQTVIDGMGATLMPGLCDAHLHLSWNNAPGIDPIQMMPPEAHTLVTAQMAKLVLDSGFTMGCGAAAAKPRLDVVVRNAINSGMIPGPRYRAAG